MNKDEKRAAVKRLRAEMNEFRKGKHSRTDPDDGAPGTPSERWRTGKDFGINWAFKTATFTQLKHIYDNCQRVAETNIFVSDPSDKTGFSFKEVSPEDAEQVRFANEVISNQEATYTVESARQATAKFFGCRTTVQHLHGFLTAACDAYLRVISVSGDEIFEGADEWVDQLARERK